jgi:uncharacterized protein (DUF2141 family)
MFKLLSAAAIATLAFAAQPSQAQSGPDAAACRAGASGPALLVNVSGFKNRNGRVRVNVYGGNPADFLAKGKMVRRIDIPVAGDPMRICVDLPKAGNYAVAVRHDANADGKSGWSDGGGFSRNPSISLTDLKPTYRETVISVGAGVKSVPVVLNYRRGLSVGPIRK